MAEDTGKQGTDAAANGSPKQGGRRGVLVAVVLAVTVAIIAVAGRSLLAPAGGDAPQPAQAVAPSDDNVATAKSEVSNLSKYVVTDLANTDGINALVAQIHLSDKAPQVSIDAANHAVSVTYTGISEQEGAAASKAGSLDRDILYNAVVILTCVEPAQQVSIIIPGGETYTFRRSELEQSFGGPLNASGSLTDDAWAEVLRKLDTENLASSLVGLSTESGKAMAQNSVG